MNTAPNEANRAKYPTTSVVEIIFFANGRQFHGRQEPVILGVRPGFASRKRTRRGQLLTAISHPKAMAASFPRRRRRRGRAGGGGRVRRRRAAGGRRRDSR